MAFPPTTCRTHTSALAKLLLSFALLTLLCGSVQEVDRADVDFDPTSTNNKGVYGRRPGLHLLTFARAFRFNEPLPPAIPGEPWQTLNESLLPYPIFYAATAVLDNSIVVLGGCLTASCAVPVGRADTQTKVYETRYSNKNTTTTKAEALAPSLLTATVVAAADGTPAHATSRLYSVDSPYHERSIALEVETKTMTPLNRLTLPPGLGFAGRHAAVTLTDIVYVPRSCTMTTLSPSDIAALSESEMQALQADYASIIAFYPEDKKRKKANLFDGAGPSVNLSYYEVPADRVRVNASCASLATENKILILGGFLLSQQRVTASVDAFNVVTRKYESDVVFLSTSVLQPSVATSAGFAAVAGGWTYAADTVLPLDKAVNETTAASLGSTAPLSGLLKPVVKYMFDLLFFEGDHLSRARPSACANREKRENLRYSGARSEAATTAASSSICLSPVDADLLPYEVVQHILLSEQGCHIEVFGGQVVLTDHNLDHLAVLDLRATSAQTAPYDMKGAFARVLYIPPPPTQHALRAARQNSAPRSSVSRPTATESVPGGVSGTQSNNKRGTMHIRERRGSVSQSSFFSSTSAHSARSLSSPTSSSSHPHPTTAALTAPPERVYRYRWEQPLLIALPLSRNVNFTKARQLVSPSITGREVTTTTIEPSSTLAPDANTATDTTLVFMALGGEDVWTQEAVNRESVGVNDSVNQKRRAFQATSHLRLLETFNAAAASSSSSSLWSVKPQPPHDEVVIRRAAAQRWARRLVPDRTFDTYRDDLFGVRMPTPIWPADMTLHITSEGTIYLDFPDVNYTRFCLWEATTSHAKAVAVDEIDLNENYQEEEKVVCAVRLSSRRDCVGNTAGTLDTFYNGAPNASILFTASGSTTPVYVCFGYVVQPTSWPACRTQRAFSVLNPMMPLRILSNAPTLPPPTPTPSRDPSDATTSSPLFIFVVGICVVTLLVAVLLVARLQHVPEEGLLVDDLFARSNSSNRHSSQGRRMGCISVPARNVDGEDDKDNRGGNEGGGNENGDGSRCPHLLTSLADFEQLVASVAETGEARMLDAAEDVLRLHQHRYRILSRVGRSDHSLCFLALRKPTFASQSAFGVNQNSHTNNVGLGAAAAISGGAGRRGVPRLPISPFQAFGCGATVPASVYKTAGGGGENATCASSLWAARYDQKASVVVKYTQCPDDTTRAVITRLCERLRDLQASSGRSGGGNSSFYSLHQNSYRHYSRGNPASRHSRSSSGAAVGWLRDEPLQPQRQQHFSNLHQQCTHHPPDVMSRAASDIITSAHQTPIHAAVQDAAYPVHFGGATDLLSTDAGQRESIADGLQITPTTANKELGAMNMNCKELNEEGACAWLDAHEVDVVLSLFLLLPADLFVSYEVSVLQQQQQQHRSSGLSTVGNATRQTPALYRATAQWNRQYMYVGAIDNDRSCNGSAHTKNSNKERFSEAAKQGSRELRDRFKRTIMTDPDERKRSEAASIAASSTHQQERLPLAVRAFLTSLAAPSPRVCWGTCANLLHPSTASPWSLCLVMPYERAGDLSQFMRRAQQGLPAHAWLTPGFWGSCITKCAEVGGADDARGKGRIRLCGEGTARSTVFDVTTAKHCWTESLLCSLLFQIGAGLQLLHQQSPPILHGNLKATNVLLREPIAFSIAGRRVHHAELPQQTSNTDGAQRDSVGSNPALAPEVDGQGSHHGAHLLSSYYNNNDKRNNAIPAPANYMPSSHVATASPLWRRGNLVAAEVASVWRAGPPSSAAATAPGAGTGAASPQQQQQQRYASPLSSSSSQHPPPLEWYLSTKSYLPVSLTDGGMSWWLSVQLPQRLRGCFGFTTHTTLRQTTAGRCWLHRYRTTRRCVGETFNLSADDAAMAAPTAESVAALAHFLYCFIEVPNYIAPELLWGQLCHLSSAATITVGSSHINFNPGCGLKGDLMLNLRARQRQQQLPARHSCSVEAQSTTQTSPSAVAMVRTDEHHQEKNTATQCVYIVPAIHPSNCNYHNRNDAHNNSTEAREDSHNLDDDVLFNDVIADKAARTAEANEVEVEEGKQKEDESSSSSGPSATDDEDDDGDEEGVFTAEEVILLTTTMWRAEGLTRASRQLQRKFITSNNNGSVDESVSGEAMHINNTTAVAAATATRPPDGMPSLFSDALHMHKAAPPAAGGSRYPAQETSVSPPLFPIPNVAAVTDFSSLLPPYTPFTSSRNPHLYLANGVHRDGKEGGGTQSSSSVYEVLIQRVLATDTASDVWSLGLLIYEMCTDAVQGNNDHASSEDDISPPEAASTMTVSATSKLAQRAFAALLGDLYALSYGTSSREANPSGLVRDVVGDAYSAIAAPSAEQEKEHSGVVEDRAWWPRSCALEDEVKIAFTSAGYSMIFAQLMARMLSPVAARRPTAAEIVDQVRLILPSSTKNTIGTSAAAASPTINSSPVIATLADVRQRVPRPGGQYRENGAHVGHWQNASTGLNLLSTPTTATRAAATESDSGNSARMAAAVMAVVLDERTALMKLRERYWC